MKSLILPPFRTIYRHMQKRSKCLFVVAFFLRLADLAHAQGTMTFTFEGQPVGTISQIGVYSESGMSFGPNGPGSLYLSGGGIAGYANNGTGYLLIPDGTASFHFTNTLPTKYFDLDSLDLAAYNTASTFPGIFQVVGYKPMAGTVTNFFTLTTALPGFQTFNLDTSFQGLFRVDIFGGGAPWSMDNVVIGGVPEPTTGSLALLGAGGAVAWSRFRRKQRSRKCSLLNTPIVAKPPQGT